MSADVEHVTCRDFVEVLTDYLEHDLDPAERAEVERHLVICRGCSDYVEQMRSTIDLLGRIAIADDDSDVQREKLRSMFREWRARRA